MRLLFIFGTRPEAIKMAPLIREARANYPKIETCICVTGQHREMLDQILSFFNIHPDVDLDIMKSGQDLFDITSAALLRLKEIISKFKPDVILVQGDTTTAFISSLAAFYLLIPVAHIEAGLRSGDNYSPFPEEVNRKLISQIATWHFAPTIKALENLNKSGIYNNVFVTGNTVIDAFFWGISILNEEGNVKYCKKFEFIDFTKKIILVTGHRRESFGKPFREICNAIKSIALSHSEIQVVYPVHLNPHVQQPVKEILQNVRNIHLTEPLDYPSLIWLLSKCYLVLTDSGGIQEEAPSLGKPVIVMRDVTERTEGIEAGNAILAGASFEKIVNAVNNILDSETIYQKMAKAGNPYGDGKTSGKIIHILLKTQINK